MSYCQIFFRQTSQKNYDLHTYNTRSKNEPHFQLFTTSLGQRSIKLKGCQLWCSLPDELRSISSTSFFLKLNWSNSYKPCNININVVWCDILLKGIFIHFISIIGNKIIIDNIVLLLVVLACLVIVCAHNLFGFSFVFFFVYVYFLLYIVHYMYYLIWAPA